MTIENFSWPEVKLDPPRDIEESQIFRGLRTVAIRRTAQLKQYVLVTEEPVLAFSVELTGILSPQSDSSDPYLLNKARANLKEVLKQDKSPVFLEFLRFSPWLLTSLNLENGLLGPVQRGVMLARLLNLFVELIENENLGVGRLRTSYRLLLRARFLVLARLSQQVYRNEAQRYLPELDILMREAWWSWGQLWLRDSRELSFLLASNGRDAEDEGKLLLFQPENDRLWPFALKPEQIQFVEQLFAGWFLPRYDLVHVAIALSQLQTVKLSDDGKSSSFSSSAANQNLERKHSWGAGHVFRIIGRLRVIGLFAVIVLLTIPLLIPLFIPNAQVRWPDLAIVGWWFAVASLIANALVCGVILYVSDLFRYLRYTLPRITLAIFVGYIALASSGELMTFAIRAYDHYPLLALVTSCGAGLLSFAGIYIETSRRLDKQWQALKRAGLVFLIAAARSLTLGWLILAPGGSLLLYDTQVVQNVDHQWASPLSLPIYPQLIFILAPLALFIGIFVQTIWDEHPLTHPL